jgi:signal transduction histidine kinase
MARTAFSTVATAVLVTAAVSMVGNLVAPEPIHALLIGQVPALHTSLALGILAAGTIALRPDVGWVRRVADLGRTGWGAAGLIGITGLLLAYGAQATVRAGAEAYGSAQAALRLESLLSSLKDAETGQRGYLLTGDEKYLVPYEAARARLPRELAILEQDHFRGSAATVARVRALTEAKLAELEETIADRRAGNLAASLAVVRSGHGEAVMDELRTRVDELTVAVNAAALDARNDELRAAALAGVGALAVMVLALWVVVATTQVRRGSAERAAAAAHAQGAAEAEARRAEERLREMQTELAHANRLSTMGQLTASIAHEVRQPIAASVANAHAGLRWLKANPPVLDEVRDALDRIVRDGNRAGDVITRVRTLLKKEPPRTEGLRINEMILQVVALLHGEATRGGFSVRPELAPDLPRVRADRVQVQQVLLNLMVNALEAMQNAGEGERELVVASIARETSVVVAVRDSGPGLGQVNPEQVFEAFYTTKPGSLGMGLSICRSIIEAHGGRLWAEANEPRGAVFQFTLPHAPPGDTSLVPSQPAAGTSDAGLESGAVAGPSASPRPFQR